KKFGFFSAQKFLATAYPVRQYWVVHSVFCLVELAAGSQSLKAMRFPHWRQMPPEEMAYALKPPTKKSDGTASGSRPFLVVVPRTPNQGRNQFQCRSGTLTQAAGASGFPTLSCSLHSYSSAHSSPSAPCMASRRRTGKSSGLSRR